MISVLVADDHPMMRHGLKQFLEVMGDVAVDGEAANGDEVMEALRRLKFDLILLDLTMPGLGGVELVAHIREQYASLPILVFSMRNEVKVAQAVLQAGASGYITKGSDQGNLMSAIRQVAAGERYVDPVIVEQLMFNKSEQDAFILGEGLSARELQIMEYLVRGKTLTAIAEELCVSVKTVSTYKTRLMQKMDFKTNAELLLYAAEYGLSKNKH